MTRYDDIADSYVGVVGDDLTDPASAALLELAEPIRGSRVLDLACGHGRVARALARRGGSVVGIDGSAALLERAQDAETAEPLGIAYVLGDASRPDVQAGEIFDGVACNFGLSDIDDLTGVVDTVRRVLRDGGWFVWSVLHPCFPGWDADAPSSWGKDGYYKEGWWLAGNSGFRGQVGANHRMLATYLNVLVDHGLAIDRVIEPMPDAAWARRLSDGVPVPVYLVVRCRRSSATAVR